MAEENKLEQQRQQRLERIVELGIDPYGSRYDDTESSVSIKARFVDGDETQRGKCAGRIVLLRDIGKLIFLTLRDSQGAIQIGLSKKLLTEQWELVKLFELGDIIGAQGQVGKTRTG